MKWLKTIGILLVGVLFLSACGGEEKEAVEKEKKEFDILYTYEVSKILPVVNEEKTPEELAEGYLRDRVGISDEEDIGFKERGVVSKQGIFIESAIYDGNAIPNISAMDQDTKDRVTDKREDRTIAKKKDEYDELIKNREDVLGDQYKDDNTERERVEEEIKQQVEEYKQDAKRNEEDEEDEKEGE